jgi:hypothetical protein
MGDSTSRFQSATARASDATLITRTHRQRPLDARLGQHPLELGSAEARPDESLAGDTPQTSREILAANLLLAGSMIRLPVSPAAALRSALLLAPRQARQHGFARTKAANAATATPVVLPSASLLALSTAA